MHLDPTLPFPETLNIILFGVALAGFLLFGLALASDAPGISVVAAPLILVGVCGGFAGYTANNNAWHESLQVQAAQHYGVELDAAQVDDLFTENFFFDNHDAQVQGSTPARVNGEVRQLTLFHVGDEWLLGTGHTLDNVRELPQAAR